MANRLRWALMGGALCGALLAGYLAIWAGVGGVDIGRSDFTSTYVGATLLREGHGPSMYEQALQTPLHSQLDPAGHGANLPFVNPPLAAAMALPVTFLAPSIAYRVWGLLQLAMLIGGLWLAVRAAPGRERVRVPELAAIVLLSLACMGTWSLLIQGQWDGVSALGLGAAYASLRRGRPVAGGVILAVTSLIAKPQIALGLAAFMIGRRDRRLILGGIAGGVVAVGLSLLVAGPGGIAGFVSGLLSSTTRWQLSTFSSFIGIGSAILGSTGGAYLFAGITGLVALGTAAGLGAAVRDRPERLEAGLAGAAVLSVLASPHAYGHDLTLLVPAAGWCFTALVAERRRLSAPRISAPILIWVAISTAAAIDVATAGAVPPGPLTPWTLIAAAVLAAVAAFRQDRREHRFETSAAATRQPPIHVTSTS